MASNVISFRPSPELYEKIMADCERQEISATEYMIRKLSSVDAMKKEQREVKYDLEKLAEWIDEKEYAPYIVVLKIKRIANSIQLPKNLSNE